MRMRLRYVLPLAQMALGAIFLRLSFVYEVAQRMADSRGVPPAFVLLLCLNLPVSIPLKLTVWGYLPTLWFDALFVSVIGVFWYWVALGIHRYNERKSVFLFARVALRITTDLGVIAMGAFLGWSLVEDAGEQHSIISRLSPSALGWWWSIPTYGSLRIWSLGPILLFGTDLIQCIRHGPQTRTQPKNEIE
jgi:hypothetical protein